MDRFARAVHRYGDRVEVVPDRGVREALRELGLRLEDALAEVRQTPHQPQGERRHELTARSTWPWRSASADPSLPGTGFR